MRKSGKNHPKIDNLIWCWFCQQYKDNSNFYRCRSNPLIYDHICKSCKGEYYRDYHHNYYLKHKDTLLPQHRISALKSLRRKMDER